MQKIQIKICLLCLTTLAFTACTSHYPTHTKASNSTTTTSEVSDTTPTVSTPITTSTSTSTSTSKTITPAPESTPTLAPNLTRSGEVSGGVSSSTASKEYTLPKNYVYSGGPLPKDIVNPIEYRVQVKISDNMPEFSFGVFGQTVQSYQLRADKTMYYLKEGVNKVNKIVVQCNPLSYQQELLFD